MEQDNELALEKMKAEYAIASKLGKAFSEITEFFFNQLHDDADYEAQIMNLEYCDLFLEKWVRTFRKELELIRDRTELYKDVDKGEWRNGR